MKKKIKKKQEEIKQKKFWKGFNKFIKREKNFSKKINKTLNDLKDFDEFDFDLILKKRKKKITDIKLIFLIMCIMSTVIFLTKDIVQK